MTSLDFPCPRKGLNNLQPMGQIQSAASFGTPCKLGMVFAFSNSYILNGDRSRFLICSVLPLGSQTLK